MRLMDNARALAKLLEVPMAGTEFTGDEVLAACTIILIRREIFDVHESVGDAHMTRDDAVKASSAMSLIVCRDIGVKNDRVRRAFTVVEVELSKMGAGILAGIAIAKAKATSAGK